MAVDFNTLIPMLVARELSGQELTDAESDMLDNWIAESDTNRDLYHNMISGESLDGYRRTAEMIDVEELLYRIRSKRRKRNLRLWGRSIAAAAVVLLAAAVTFLKMDKVTLPKSESEEVLLATGSAKAILTIGDSRVALSGTGTDSSWMGIADRYDDQATAAANPMVRIETPKGGEYAVQLPDGTVVKLNAASMIEYPKYFAGDSRPVQVRGEAFFDVAHDPSKPFIVKTSQFLDIKVLGTKFVVNDYSDEVKTQVALVEGRVTLQSGNRQAGMEAGQLALFEKDNQQITVNKVPDMRRYTAWTEGQFYYKEASLEQIFKGLARWYDVEIDFSQVRTMGLGEATLIFNRKDNLQTVLEALKSMTGLQYEIAKNNKRIIVIKN